MIYTSYFAAVNKIAKAIPDAKFISIARYPPRGWSGLQLKCLAPPASLLQKWKETHNEDDYIHEYEKTVLSKFSSEKIIEMIEVMAGGSDVVILLCYEKPNDFCHRHLVGNFLGIEEFEL